MVLSADEFLAVGVPCISFLRVLSRMASCGVIALRLILGFGTCSVQFLLTSAITTECRNLSLRPLYYYLSFFTVSRYMGPSYIIQKELPHYPLIPRPLYCCLE